MCWSFHTPVFFMTTTFKVMELRHREAKYPTKVTWLEMGKAEI